jgi:two-component system phosphate regulon sensor histidine kinase PhoR
MAGLPETRIPFWRPGALLRAMESALSVAGVRIETLQERLAHGNVSHQTVLESMMEGVMITDASSRFLMVNDAFRALFHQTQPLAGRTVIETLRNTAIHEAVRKAAGGDEITDVEIEDAAAPGRTFLMSARPIKDGQGGVIGVVAVFHDHTRLKRLERSRREFVENVSHELRTPLSVIRGYIETILETPNLKRAELEEFLGTAKKHSDRLTNLISDLLTLSRLEAAEAEPQPVAGSCEVKGTVEKALNDLRRIADRKDIALSSTCLIGTRHASIDAARLEQVLFNLLDNAIKYSPAGGKVGVSSMGDEREIIVCVADTGPGIPESSLPHVFERFYRVDRARAREDGGTGLGLSIVKHIVQSSGGRVWVESRVGEGSRFFFTLRPA